MIGAVGITEHAAELGFLYVDAPRERGQREHETCGHRQPIADREAEPSKDQQQRDPISKPRQIWKSDQTGQCERRHGMDSGRVATIRVDPTNPATVYIGAIGGGI